MKKNKKSWLYYLIAILALLFGGTSVVGTATDMQTTVMQDATVVVEEQIQTEKSGCTGRTVCFGDYLLFS